MSKGTPLKVLVSAYACEPGKGSEPGAGWNWVKQISRFEECWVITRLSNRALIEEALKQNPMPRTHFVYYDLPDWARFWKKGQRGVRAYYYFWQLGAYRFAKGLHSKLHFDLVHHLTFANYWLPSFLPFLAAPFLWGPVGGGESAPASFRTSFSLRGQLYEALRDTARYFGELNPFVRMTARRAAAGLAVTPQTADRLRALGCRNVSLSSQSALSTAELSFLQEVPARLESPFRIVSIGRFLHWKGFELGIQAFVEFHRRHPESEYWLIGDGPERERWERLGKNGGSEKNIVFWPTLPRAEVLEKLAACDVLLHPSLHDSGSWVTIEAMAAGRPVICLDLGGPGLQVTAATGFKIAAISPEQVVADIATALEQIASNSSYRARLGQAGRARIQQHYHWDKLGDQLSIIYAGLVKA